MNDEAFNLSVRKFLKHFGVDAQRTLLVAMVAPFGKSSSCV